MARLNDHLKLGLRNTKGLFLCLTTIVRSPAKSTKTTAKWILEMSELLDMRLSRATFLGSLVFSTGSAIRKWPHCHPRGLQISGLRRSLTLHYQETSCVFPQRTLDGLLFESRVLTLYFNWWRLKHQPKRLERNIKKIVSVKPLFHYSGNRELTLKCKLKCYFKPMNNPLGVSPSKGKQGTTRGKEKIFWPRWESNPRPWPTQKLNIT